MKEKDENEGIIVDPLTEEIKYVSDSKEMVPVTELKKVSIKLKNRKGRFVKLIRDGEGIFKMHFAIVEVDFDPEYPSELNVKVKEHGETEVYNLNLSEPGEKIITCEPGKVQVQEGEYQFDIEWSCNLFKGSKFQELRDASNYGYDVVCENLYKKALEYNKKLVDDAKEAARGEVSPKVNVIVVHRERKSIEDIEQQPVSGKSLEDDIQQ